MQSQQTMQVLKYPNSKLTTKCPDYDESKFGEDVASAMAMEEVMGQDFGKNWKAVGLAAPQVGISRRFFLLAPKGIAGEVTYCFNPRIVGHGQEMITQDESCLSHLGKIKPISRYAVIDIVYLDKDFKLVAKTLKRWEARIFQHEMDHLDGVCVINKEEGK